MSDLSLDKLFAIAEASPVLDKVEEALRAAGKSDAADALVKLQQDVGLEIDNEMTGSFNQTPAGPQTAKLMMEYQPVTYDRVVAVLSDSYAGVPEAADKKKVMDVIHDLGPAAPQSAAAGAAKSPKL